MSLGPKQNIHCICVSSFLSDPNVLLIKKRMHPKTVAISRIFLFLANEISRNDDALYNRNQSMLVVAIKIHNVVI